MKLKELFRFGDQRFVYWSCTKFTRKIRALFNNKVDPKPSFGTSEQWDDYKKAYSKLERIDDMLDFIQNVIYYPLDILNRIRIYLDNIWYQTHTAKTTLEKGKWYDTDTRLFYCVFGLLEQFVEGECARLYIICFPDKVKKPAFFKYTKKRVSNGEFGINYLVDSCDDRDNEIIFLYKWSLK